MAASTPGVMRAIRDAMRGNGKRMDSDDDVAAQENALKFLQNEYLDADEPNLLDEDDMYLFELHPLSDNIKLVCCKLCQRTVKESHYASHAERCKAFLSQKGKKENEPVQNQVQSPYQTQTTSSPKPQQRRSRKKFEEGNSQEENFTSPISKAARTKKSYSSSNVNNAGNDNLAKKPSAVFSLKKSNLNSNSNFVLSPSKKAKVSSDASLHSNNVYCDVHHQNGIFFFPTCSPLASKHICIHRLSRTSGFISTIFQEAVQRHEEIVKGNTDSTNSNAIKTNPSESKFVNVDSSEPLVSPDEDQTKLNRTKAKVKVSDAKPNSDLSSKPVEKEKNTNGPNPIPSQSKPNQTTEKHSKTNAVPKQKSSKTKESTENTVAKLNRSESQGQRKPSGSLPGNVRGKISVPDAQAASQVVKTENDSKKKKVPKKITNPTTQTQTSSQPKPKPKSTSKTKPSKAKTQSISPSSHSNAQTCENSDTVFKHVNQSHTNTVNAFQSTQPPVPAKSDNCHGRNDIEEIELMGDKNEDEKQIADGEGNDRADDEGGNKKKNLNEIERGIEDDDYNYNDNEEEGDDDDDDDDENEMNMYHQAEGYANDASLDRNNHNISSLIQEKHDSGKAKGQSNASSSPSSPSSLSLQNTKNKQSKNKRANNINTSFPSIAHSFSEMKNETNAKRKFYFPLTYTAMANQLNHGIQNQNQSSNLKWNSFASPHLPPSPYTSFSSPQSDNSPRANPNATFVNHNANFGSLP